MPNEKEKNLNRKNEVKRCKTKRNYQSQKVKRKETKKLKRNEKKRKIISLLSQNAAKGSETVSVSLRFASKRKKKYKTKMGHPSSPELKLQLT